MSEHYSILCESYPGQGNSTDKDSNGVVIYYDNTAPYPTPSEAFTIYAEQTNFLMLTFVSVRRFKPRRVLKKEIDDLHLISNDSQFKRTLESIILPNLMNLQLILNLPLLHLRKK